MRSGRCPLGSGASDEQAALSDEAPDDRIPIEQSLLSFVSHEAADNLWRWIEYLGHCFSQVFVG